MEYDIKRQANNIWIEYCYGYLTADKAIELLEMLWISIIKTT